MQRTTLYRPMDGRVLRFVIGASLVAVAVVLSAPLQAGEVYDLSITGGRGGDGLAVSDNPSNPRTAMSGDIANYVYGPGTLDGIEQAHGQGGLSANNNSNAGDGASPATSNAGGDVSTAAIPNQGRREPCGWYLRYGKQILYRPNSKSVRACTASMSRPRRAVSRAATT